MFAHVVKVGVVLDDSQERSGVEAGFHHWWKTRRTLDGDTVGAAHSERIGQHSAGRVGIDNDDTVVGRDELDLRLLRRKRG